MSKIPAGPYEVIPTKSIKPIPLFFLFSDSVVGVDLLILLHFIGCSKAFSQAFLKIWKKENITFQEALVNEETVKFLSESG